MINTAASPVSPIIVSITVQDCRVCFSLSPINWFTSQNPESFNGNITQGTSHVLLDGFGNILNCNASKNGNKNTDQEQGYESLNADNHYKKQQQRNASGGEKNQKSGRQNEVILKFKIQRSHYQVDFMNF